MRDFALLVVGEGNRARLHYLDTVQQLRLELRGELRRCWQYQIAHLALRIVRPLRRVHYGHPSNLSRRQTVSTAKMAGSEYVTLFPL
jgi:hypothetical protein